MRGLPAVLFHALAVAQPQFASDVLLPGHPLVLRVCVVPGGEGVDGGLPQQTADRCSRKG